MLIGTTKPFAVGTDADAHTSASASASDFAIGSILSQEINGKIYDSVPYCYYQKLSVLFLR
jgi:hypothetical protein